jgi:hypothetical protein
MSSSVMRSSALAAAVLALAILVASGGIVGTAARPVVGRQGGGFVAVELTGTDSSAQPSNCTYGNNVGGVCPPTPTLTPPSAGH